MDHLRDERRRERTTDSASATTDGPSATTDGPSATTATNVHSTTPSGVAWNARVRAGTNGMTAWTPTETSQATTEEAVC